MTTGNADIRIGTSGWSYDHWQGVFYPDGLPKGVWLNHYARHLRTVEINNSFYHLPEAKTLRHWRDRVPANFQFALKASRYITHMKKLKDPHDGLKTLIQRASTLEEKLGPILFQLPPRWRFNEERLAVFLDSLSADFRYAFEFRDHSWLNGHTYSLLEQHGAALCIYDLDGFQSPKEVTANFVYVRLHGPDGAYQGSYGGQSLSGWAGALSAWARHGRDVYCYFDNDQAGYAAENAQQLSEMLEDR